MLAKLTGDTKFYGNADEFFEAVRYLIAAPVDANKNTSHDLDFHGTDDNLHGAKAGLHLREKRMTLLQLHHDKGHVGWNEDCEICKLAKKSLRRIAKKVDPYVCE